MVIFCSMQARRIPDNISPTLVCATLSDIFALICHDCTCSFSECILSLTIATLRLHSHWHEYKSGYQCLWVLQDHKQCTVYCHINIDKTKYECNVDQELYTELLSGSWWVLLLHATYTAAGARLMLHEYSADSSTFCHKICQKCGPNRKSGSDNRCILTWRTITPNFIVIWFEMMETSNKSNNINKMSSNMGSVPDPKQVTNY